MAVWAAIRKLWVPIGSLLLTLLTIGSLAAFTAWGVEPTMLRSDAHVTVSEDGEEIQFTHQDPRLAGLVFYPGAMVDPHAYVPMARHVADQGFDVRIVKVPLRLAPTRATQEQLFGRTLAAMAADSAVHRWIVAGHSKGGKLAAQFVQEHPASAAGLVLVGTSHPVDIDLSGLRLDVTKVYGSRDGLASEAEVKRYASNLPAATHWVRIDGGNHAQFAYYLFQIGDSRATITREAQQAQLTAAIVDALVRVEHRAGAEVASGSH